LHRQGEQDEAWCLCQRGNDRTETGARVFRLTLRVASGERTKVEAFDFGAAEFAPWVLGATM
jgi:altronate hydrolase